MAEINLPTIPSKRYFTIGEVSELCNVKPHVLRYWEQEFSQLRPVKRRGNRRYYQHHEVMLIRRIRELLYEEGFTINGARSRLTELNRVTSLDSLSAITPLGAMADARAANFKSTKNLLQGTRRPGPAHHGERFQRRPDGAESGGIRFARQNLRIPGCRHHRNHRC